MKILSIASDPTEIRTKPIPVQ